MKSKQDSLSVLETIKELLFDTSGIIGTPEERADWKKYYEDQAELSKAVAAEIEKENAQPEEQKKSTWLQKIKDALRYIFTDTHGECTIPDDVIKRLAKALLPNILAFFESEEGKKEFGEWKQQKEQEKASVKEENSEA